MKGRSKAVGIEGRETENVCLLRWDRALGVKILEEMSNREREVQGTDVGIKRKRKFLKRQKHLGPGRRWESKP